jgi:hypothetical protein
MNILKNFRNPWEAATEVLKTSVLDSKVLETKVLDTGVLEGSVLEVIDLTSQQKEDRGTHFYDEAGNLIYKSKYGKGAAITILYPDKVEDFKLEFGIGRIVVPVVKPEEENDEVMRKYRGYGITYILKAMLEVYERSKTDKRTQYNPYTENGELKSVYYTYSNSDKLLPKQPPVEVACPLFVGVFDGYPKVEVENYDTMLKKEWLAIGNTPLHIYVEQVEAVKDKIGGDNGVWVSFLHIEPVVRLKNIRENNESGAFDVDTKYLMCHPSSEHDIRHYYRHQTQSPYFAIIIRPHSIVFFKGKVDEFNYPLETDFICIKKTDLP